MFSYHNNNIKGDRKDNLKKRACLEVRANLPSKHKVMGRASSHNYSCAPSE